MVKMETLPKCSLFRLQRWKSISLLLISSWIFIGHSLFALNGHAAAPVIPRVLESENEENHFAKEFNSPPNSAEDEFGDGLLLKKPDDATLLNVLNDWSEKLEVTADSTPSEDINGDSYLGDTVLYTYTKTPSRHQVVLKASGLMVVVVSLAFIVYALTKKYWKKDQASKKTNWRHVFFPLLTLLLGSMLIYGTKGGSWRASSKSSTPYSMIQPASPEDIEFIRGLLKDVS